MSDDQLSVGTAGAAPVTNQVQAPASTTERAKVVQLAQEFEAMLMTQMLREMRSSMLEDEGSEGGYGRETMQDTADIALGQALSRAGGVGLSSIILKSLDDRLNGTFKLPAGSTPAAPGVMPQTGPETLSTVPSLLVSPSTPPVSQPTPGGGSDPLALPSGQLSSNYGWRRDPFTGAATFHKGIDVAQPYGQNVQAAASGRVMFAGEQGGYGTMVVVDHGQGRQTRYAHLSGTAVKAGDQVVNGQVIGTIGSSGRSTGPHLHFEVIEDGQSVDPLAGH